MLLSVACLLTACVSLPDPETSQIHNWESIATIGPTEENVFSQTFVSRRAGLNSLKFWVTRTTAQLAGQGAMTIEIIPDPPTGATIYRSLVSVNTIDENTPITIDFPSLKDPPQQTYRLILRAQDALIDIRGRNEDIYPNGEAFLNNSDVGDIAFSTTYQYGMRAVIEDLNSLLRHAWLVMVIGIVLIVPGWFILRLLKLTVGFDLWEKLVISAAVSLAVFPLVMLWTTQFSLKWSGTGLWIVLVSMISYSIIDFFIHREKRLQQPVSLTDILALVTILVVCATRLVMIRDMSAPAWVDSIHHAWIGRLISEQGGFPDTFLPYEGSNVTSYHLGFHSTLASLKLLTGQDFTTILLIFGQALNVFAVLGIYQFTKSLTGDKLAALTSALAAGVFSPMPAYFTSWGRYTHLAGLVIMPVAAVYLLKYFDPGDIGKQWSKLGLTAILSAGLFMVHYRIAGFLALLIAIVLINHLLTEKAQFREKLRISTKAVFWIGLLSILLTAPWFFRTIHSTVLPTISQPVSQAGYLDGFSWQLILAGLGKYPFIIACLGLILSFFLRDQIGRILLGWIALMSGLANLHALGLPGGYLVNNTTFAITLYLPISALAGYFLSRLVNFSRKIVPVNFHLWGRWMCVLLFCAALVYGSRNIIYILNQNTYLTRQADLDAVEWVKQNIPPDALILVNPFLWGYGLYAGGDGGYWITALSGQPTIPPPVIQNPADWETFPAVNTISAEVLAARTDPQDLHDIMVSNHIQYAFLGGRGGILSPSILSSSELFDQVYAENGVRIFRVVGGD